jgi:3-oxoacyl-(acyl-carrier-protein) synthase
LVVEAEAAARARGARLLASVAGWGFGFQAAGSGAAAGAMGRAMERAGLEPTDIDAVLLHREFVATAWEEERHAVTEVFGSRAGAPLRLASKRALGHTLAGAAALDAVLALRVLTTGVAPRALLCPSDERPPHSLPGGPVSFPQRPRRVLVNARSWSGHAASLILETVD